ncbi:hypothetical protein SAMN04487980_100919 [Streptomyces sp. cf124]|nr:hypothetical protein SAMN04487980_100919 [Streptomyces sp. cf124]
MVSGETRRIPASGNIGITGGIRKYSVSLPAGLVEAVRAQVGSGGSSAHVAEALEQRVAMDGLREIVTDFETDNAPLSRKEVETARAVLSHDCLTHP